MVHWLLNLQFAIKNILNEAFLCFFMFMVKNGTLHFPVQRVLNFDHKQVYRGVMEPGKPFTQPEAHGISGIGGNFFMPLRFQIRS